MKNIIFIIIIIVLFGIGGFLLLNNNSKTQNLSTQVPNQITPTNTSNSVKQVDITVTKSGFQPRTLTVKKGEIVVWTNKSGDVVTVNSNDHPTHKLYPPLNLGEFNDGLSVQLTFDKPGTYGYHNHLNPSQTGTIIVE